MNYIIIAQACQAAFSEAFEERTRHGVAMCAQRIADVLQHEDPTGFDSEVFIHRALTDITHS